MMTADVLVIGAGAAGLACAATVAAAGRSVVVLEARNVIGGRIRTHHSASGATWEMGAQVVHDRTNSVWSHFDPGVVQPFSNGQFRALLGSRSLPLHLLARLGLPPWMIVPTMAAATPPVLGSPARWLAGLSAPVAKLGFDWLGQDWAADPAELDVPELLGIAAAPGALGDEGIVVGGWDAFLIGLARTLDVRLSTPVRRLVPAIGAASSGVTAHTDSGSFSAGAVVVTVPPWTVGPGGLRIEGLPPEKREAAAGLRGGDAVVALVRTTVPAPETASVFDAGHGWGFLRAQRGDPQIQIVAKGPGAQRLRSVLAGLGTPDALGAVLGRAFPWAAGAEFELTEVLDWGNEEFIGGAFTSPTPGRSRYSAAWAAPVQDRMFFAGESTSGARGVGRVHGALAGGLRAAREVLGAPGAVPDIDEKASAFSTA